MARNENLNINKLNTISASENGSVLKNSAPENLEKAPYVCGNNSAQVQLQKSDISNTVLYVNKKKDCNKKFNRYLHQQHSHQIVVSPIMIVIRINPFQSSGVGSGHACHAQHD